MSRSSDTSWIFKLQFDQRTSGACPECGTTMVVTTSERGAVVRECSNHRTCSYMEPCPADVIARLMGNPSLPGFE